MLKIYAPKDKPASKCWEIFRGITKTWPDGAITKDNHKTIAESPALFWGFVNNNIPLIHQLEDKGQDFWFSDTPYFGRYDNNNLQSNNHYWRFCKNRIHAQYIKDCPKDRFEKFNLQIKISSKNRGDYVLICPSSPSVHQYLKKPNWLESTVQQIKKFTDRPIKIRNKPRKNGFSGPAVADIPIEEDLKNAWACVTSCSISAVEALLNGVSVFSDYKSFARTVSSQDLSEIEKPFYVDPTTWFYSLAYQQFTPEEFNNGTAISILKELKLL